MPTCLVRRSWLAPSAVISNHGEPPGVNIHDQDAEADETRTPVATRTEALLLSGVDAVAREDLDPLTDAALGDDLVFLRRQIDRLEAEFCRRLRRFDCRQGHAADGAGSIVSWLRRSCRLSSSAAAQRVEMARRLPELPTTEHAFQRGEISFQHAAVIARAATDVGAAAVREVEVPLLEAAQQLDPRRLRLVTRHLRHCVDPDGALEAADRDHQNRRVYLSETFDGLFVLDGLLDAEGGAALHTALNALSTPMRGDERTAAQRRADALVELATRHLHAGKLPSVAGQRPHLMVTAPIATLRREPGAPGADLAWGGPIAAETVRRLACDAAVSNVTLGSGSEPLNVGRARRTIPAAIRRALILRDRGCRFPGCDRPPEWTDGHHLRHWADGGATRLDNLVLLCRVHHRAVHEQRWHLELDGNGDVSARPP